MFFVNAFIKNKTDQEKSLKLFGYEYVKHANFFYKKDQIILIYVVGAKLFSFKKYFSF